MNRTPRLTFGRCAAALVLAGVLQLPAAPAGAQLLDQLKGAVGSGQSGGMLGGSGLPSVGQASPSNTAGVLQYCVRNNYVGGSDATSVKDSLLSRVTGARSNDSGFQSGSNGILDTGNGQTYNLAGSGNSNGGIKAQVTQKVCDLILQHAKSLL